MSDLGALLKLPRLCVLIFGGIVAVVVTAMMPQPAQAVPFQQYRSASGCSPVALCRVSFPVVAANRAFDIKSVSCSNTIGNQTVEILEASLNVVRNSDDVTVIRDRLLPVLQGRNGLGTWFSINQQTQVTISAGFYAQVAISADVISSQLLSCKISGDLRTVP